MTKFPSPLRSERGLMNAYDCGCQIRSDGSGVYYLCACPLHNAAQELLEALQAMLADVEVGTAGLIPPKRRPCCRTVKISEILSAPPNDLRRALD